MYIERELIIGFDFIGIEIVYVLYRFVMVFFISFWGLSVRFFFCELYLGGLFILVFYLKIEN